MSEKPFHNFIIVGASKSGKSQKLLLVEIATELYSKVIDGLIYPPDPLEKKFLKINDSLADTQGYVETGQILYLPPIHPIESDAVITKELIMLNNMVLHNLDDKAKVIHGRRHHLLSTMVASTGLSTDIGIDLRKSYLKLAADGIKQHIKKISFYAKSARTLNSDNAFYWGRGRINSELKGLELSSERYLKYANSADNLSRMDIQAATGIQWNRMIYDVKRVGIDRASIKMMSRHLSATIRMASKVRHLGKIALALSAGEAIYETGEVCRQAPWGTTCYDEGFKQAGKLGFGYFGARIADSAAEKFGLVKGACNLLFDEEGLGLPLCNVVLPVVVSVGSGYVFGKAGSSIGNSLYNVGYYKTQGHKVKIEER